jgi:hypothetical protein
VICDEKSISSKTYQWWDNMVMENLSKRCQCNEWHVKHQC